MLERWRERDVFHESIRRREGAPPFVFYEGPPTANGRPGSHHVLARVFKDVFPRYKTMRGHFVPRKGGWDCHGLPVELEVEKELGFQRKEDIERYGVAEFNAKCRESVLRYIDEWNELTERIGFWIDTDDAYYTLANEYIESVWWSLKQVWEKGLPDEGHKVVPYCPRCGTALSSHEVALGYQDVVDPSRLRALPAARRARASRCSPGRRCRGRSCRTPRSRSTPTSTYVRARLGDEMLILAEALVERVLGEDAEIEERMPGLGRCSACATSRRSRTSPTTASAATPCSPATSCRPRTAPAWCTPARPSARTTSGSASENGLTIHNPVRPDGTFDERIGPFAGRTCRTPTPDIVEALRESGRLFRAERVRARLPALLALRHAAHLLRQDELVRAHHRRCKDELLRRERDDRLVPGAHQARALRQVAREQRGLGAVARALLGHAAADLALRATGHVRLRRLARASCASCGGDAPEDLHRPYIDEVVLRCEDCGGEMRRVPEVIDVWWDSGCMPFAQWHAPFENEDMFERALPGRLHLRGARPDARLVLLAARGVDAAVRPQSSYKTVLCLGLILDPDGPEDVQVEGQRRGALGRDRPPRRGRVPLVLLHLEAAVGRLPLLARDGRRDRAPVPASRSGTRTRFYVLYANVNGVEPGRRRRSATDLDRWIAVAPAGDHASA